MKENISKDENLDSKQDKNQLKKVNKQKQKEKNIKDTNIIKENEENEKLENDSKKSKTNKQNKTDNEQINQIENQTIENEYKNLEPKRIKISLVGLILTLLIIISCITFGIILFLQMKN